MTEATTERSPESSFSHLVEKSKETQARIIEHNLLSYMERYDRLTERTGQIEHTLQLFKSHLRQDQQPREGYEIILEDIRANPDVEERARQLLQMEELMDLINSGNLTRETLTQVKANLDQRKQRDLAVRIGVIMQRIMDSRTFKKTNTDLLAQIKITFDNDLAKLRHYRDEETVSRWTLESPLPTEPLDSDAAIEIELPILAIVVRDYTELTKTIKEEELDYIRTNLTQLSGNRDQLMDSIGEASAFEKTSERDETIQSLEKDIAEIDGFIQREQARLSNLEPKK